tara:strand:+ start:1306 stop:1557 length:252 start_codon:yes stop_codon:yes gene_type:complete
MPERQEQFETETIDITPTWEGIIYEMLRVLPYATPKGRGDIHQHILDAARVADQYVAHSKECLINAEECLDKEQRRGAGKHTK